MGVSSSPIENVALLAAAGDGPRLVTFEGVISHKGRFGHMGSYPHAFVLTTVRAAQATANPDTDCD